MSRRKLLTEDERAHLFGIPIDEAGLARHYTLSPDDLELLHAKRGARNILGAAVQLALLRHPGFGLRGDELVSRRQGANATGPRPGIGRQAPSPVATWRLPLMMRHATDAVAATDKGALIVGAVDGFRPLNTARSRLKLVA